MIRRSVVATFAFPICGLAVGVLALADGNRSIEAASTDQAQVAVASLAGAHPTVAVQAKGRYKKEGDLCVWNSVDSGPMQCTPVLEGKFKKTGDACAWDTSGRGPDECRPSSGRFKQEGSACVWNGSDSGPDQCNPRKAR